MNRVRSLIITSHPGPSPAITALTTLLAVASARGKGKVPFFAAIGIAAVDVVLFALGGEALT